MNVHDGTLSDLLFDEDDEFLDALEEAVEEAVEKLSEIISLYETGWTSRDTCDFYDEYEELENKYLKESAV